MAKIRQSNLDNSIVTGLTELGTGVATADQVIIYDQSSGTLKKISQTNFLNFPTISSVSPTSATSGDGTGNYTFTITGSGFTGASATLINTSGTTVNFDSVTVDSDTQITGVIAKSSLPGSGEPYDVKVTAASGLISTLEDQINIDQQPVYNTAAGSIISEVQGTTISTTDIEAYDPESAGNVTFEIQSGSLPAGLSATTVHENGISKYRITGTLPSPGSTTVYNFTLRAVDAASNTSSRAFSITARVPVSQSFTSSGTFSVPSGITSIDLLVVGAGGGGGGSADNPGSFGGGGGGGAGGLVFMPGYPVTPGGTVTVTVGCGLPGGAQGVPNACAGTRGNNGQPSTFGSPGDPGLGSGGVITGAGGGGGGGVNIPGNDQYGAAGGSGGGAGDPGSKGPGVAGSATQPTQPGNSGAYGFGNPGGSNTDGQNHTGGGGGGAGAAGQNGGPVPLRADGGIGRAYTIADGTTPVYYAGGGGGGTGADQPGTRGLGGTGGGGNSGGCAVPYAPATPGTANRGGGGGASRDGTPGGAGSGGKGIVIVRY